MQKRGCQQRDGALQHIGHALQGVILRPARGKGFGLARIERLARGTPGFVLLIVCTNHLACQQIAPELVLIPHENVQLAVVFVGQLRLQAFHQFIAVLCGILLALALDMLHKPRQLQCGQGAFGIDRGRLAHSGLLTHLPAEINQHIDHDQGNRHPRRRFQRGFVFNRYGQKHDGRIVKRNDTNYTD